MSKQSSLKTIFAIALGGLLFAGYLSYLELGMHPTGQSCPSSLGAPFGYPACVYGFFIFLTVALIASMGLRSPTETRTLRHHLSPKEAV